MTSVNRNGSYMFIILLWADNFRLYVFRDGQAHPYIYIWKIICCYNTHCSIHFRLEFMVNMHNNGWEYYVHFAIIAFMSRLNLRIIKTFDLHQQWMRLNLVFPCNNDNYYDPYDCMYYISVYGYICNLNSLLTSWFSSILNHQRSRGIKIIELKIPSIEHSKL